MTCYYYLQWPFADCKTITAPVKTDITIMISTKRLPDWSTSVRPSTWQAEKRKTKPEETPVAEKPLIRSLYKQHYLDYWSHCVAVHWGSWYGRWTGAPDIQWTGPLMLQWLLLILLLSQLYDKAAVLEEYFNCQVLNYMYNALYG